jgi:hypothetical protein
MKAYGGVDVYINIFLTPALAGGEWSDSRPGRFTLGEKATRTYWIGGWVNRRPGLDDVEKRKFLTLPGLEFRLLSRPARRQSLYRLRYSGSFSKKLYLKKRMASYSGYYGIFRDVTPCILVQVYKYSACLANSSNPDMETVCSSEMSANFCQTT